MTTPDFESIYNEFETKMFRDAYAAITTCDLWDWMREFRPRDGDGFMFSTHPNLNLIQAKMAYADHHSGASWAMTMRVMESIAKKGWEAHKSLVREAKATRQLEQWAATQHKPKGRPCPCRAAQGFTDGWCGVAGGGVPACDH